MHPNFAGALLNSALYLVCVFVAALVMGNKAAVFLAIIAMGATYVSHLMAYRLLDSKMGARAESRSTVNGVVAFSITLGAGAGLALLF